MKLIVYTNLETYEEEGLLERFGLTFEDINLRLVKGIGAGGTSDHLRNKEEAAGFSILLCHQSADTEDILPLLDPGEGWAIVLHRTNSKRLRNLYSRLSRAAAGGKVIYRYEHSGWGPTVDLLRRIGPEMSPEAFRTSLKQYFSDFEAGALLTFKRDLLNDPTLFNGRQALAEWLGHGRASYLWARLFTAHPDLIPSMQAYFAAEDEEAIKAAYLEIRQLLKS